MVPIDDQFYYLDIEEIFNFIFKKTEGMPVYDEEIIRGPKDGILQKTSILKQSEDKYANVRYDMIKEMLNNFYSSGIESEDGNIKYTQAIEELSLSSKLIFNTLIESKFIKNRLNE